MNSLTDLYQQVILDHNRSPRNFKKPPHTNRQAEGDNPLCGDHFTLYLEVVDDTIKDIGFEGSGCAISKASASLLTQAVKGKTKDEADELFHEFHAMVTDEPAPEPDKAKLGKLAVFAGVRQFPARVKCANLAWHALHAALRNRDSVSTE